MFIQYNANPNNNLVGDCVIRYQLNELPKQTVVYAMKDVCKELNEFVHILYSNTDMQEEREEIKNLIANLADMC